MNLTSKNDISMSCHADMRMRQMKLHAAEVTQAVAQPEIVYPGKPNRGRDTRVAIRGRLAVVHSFDGVVITVLWHRAEARFAA